MDILRAQLDPAAGIIYLAGPYTDPDPEVRAARAHDATIASARLIEQGYIVYSPLTMTHPIDVQMSADGETQGSDYWVAFDEAFMEHCAAIVVLMTSGWAQSRGVAREVGFFEQRARHIIYADPRWFGIRSAFEPETVDSWASGFDDQVR